MAILKRVFSVFLALALILTAVLILGLAIGRTFNSLANIFYLIIKKLFIAGIFF